MHFINQLLETLFRFFTFPLFRLGSQPISLVWLLNLLLALLAIVFFAGLLKRFLKQRVLVHLGIDTGNRESIATLCSYSLGAVLLVVVLDMSGLNLGSLALVAGGLGVGIGLGLQEIARNLISGITLLLERQLKAGDYVEINNLAGRIKEISIRSTVIHTFDGGDAIVPNSSLIENQVLNWSYSNPTGRIKVPISVSNVNSPLQVTEALLQAAYQVPEVLRDPSPKAVFLGFGDECFNFELWVWVSHIDQDQGLLVRSALFHAIEYAIRQWQIPLPTSSDLNVQLKNLLPAPETTPAIPATAQPNGAAGKAVTAADGSLIRLLKGLDLFASCQEPELYRWLDLGHRLDLEKDQVLYRDGQIVDAFYIVLTGVMESILKRENKQYRTYYPGDIFGEFTLLLNLPALFTVQAIDKTCLFVINQTNFWYLLRERPKFADPLLQELDQSRQTLEQKKQAFVELGVSLGIKDEQSLFTWVQSKLAGLLNL